MSVLVNPRAVTRLPTRFELILVDPQTLGDSVEQGRQEWESPKSGNTFTSSGTTASLAYLHVTSPSLPAENRAESAVVWQEMDRLALNREPVVVSSSIGTPTGMTNRSLRSLLRMQLRDDRLRRMSPERRAIYERIRKLRDEIGPIDFDAVEALCEPRENAWLSADLLHFCSRQGILPYLPVAIESIEACFSSIQELHLQPEQDPETGAEWLVLNVTIQEDEEKVLDAYGRYTDRWVSAVPWPERNKVCLSYNII